MIHYELTTVSTDSKSDPEYDFKRNENVYCFPPAVLFISK